MKSVIMSDSFRLSSNPVEVTGRGSVVPVKRLGTGIAVVAFALVGCSAQAEPEPDPLNYVALGDSAAAGPRIPDQVGAPGCEQSNSNYPHEVAELVGTASFTDVSCSGAVTDNILSIPQDTSSGEIPLQIEALQPDTELVTVTIGGNDIELIQTAVGCISFAENPAGNVCRDRLTEGGQDAADVAIEENAPKWGEMLDAIAERSPNARVLVVGYGTYLPEGGCFPTQPVLPGDADYIQGSISKLNDALKVQADERGAIFVDTEQLSVGRDVCGPADQRYFEGVQPENPAAPLHPNAAGMAAIAEAVAAVAREE